RKASRKQSGASPTRGPSAFPGRPRGGARGDRFDFTCREDSKTEVQTLLNLLSSVALLVWGTHIVRTGILRVFGANLRDVLARSVSNRAKAFVAGLGVTALVQSSSATAMIASGFVSQGLIALGPALVIMLGADVGSAVMAMVFSFDLSWL